MRGRKIFRTMLILAIIGILAVVFAWLYAFHIEPAMLLVKTYEIEVSGWPEDFPEIKVAQLTDIHSGGPYIDEEKLRLIVEKTNAAQPDIILLTGDYGKTDQFNEPLLHPDSMMKIFKDLEAPLGVWSVLGNHDIWYDAEISHKALENAGIPVLHDEAVPLEWQGETLWLVGISDAFEQEHDLVKAFAEVDDDPYIAITHTPDLFAEYDYPNGILLAGHTHGGQVVFPFIGRLKVPSHYGERFSHGLIEERGSQMYVSTGIGTSILPVRFGNPPEITILKMKGTGK